MEEKKRKCFGKEITNNTGGIYYIIKDNKYISTVISTAENSCNGSIIAVATDKEY